MLFMEFLVFFPPFCSDWGREVSGFGTDTLEDEGDKRLNCGSELHFF